MAALAEAAVGEAPHEKALGDSFGLSPPHGDFWGERSFAAMAAWLGDIGTAASRSEACRRGGGFRFGFCICLCFDAAAAFGPSSTVLTAAAPSGAERACGCTAAVRP